MLCSSKRRNPERARLVENDEARKVSRGVRPQDPRVGAEPLPLDDDSLARMQAQGKR